MKISRVETIFKRFVYSFPLLILLILIPACFNGISNESVHFFAQIKLQHPTYWRIQKAIVPKINNIIDQELQKENVKQEMFNECHFFAKNKQDITLFYLPYIQSKKEIIAAFDDINFAPVKNISFSDKADFFGDNLVLLIHDADRELAHINTQIKGAMRHAYVEYLRIHKKMLYDVLGSEQFPYVPHFDCGRLKTSTIKKIVVDQERAEWVINTIKQRVKDEIFPLIKTFLPNEEQKIEVSEFCLFDIKQKKCIKRYEFAK